MSLGSPSDCQAASRCLPESHTGVLSTLIAGMELTRTGPAEGAAASSASSVELVAKLAAANAKLAECEGALKEVRYSSLQCRGL